MHLPRLAAKCALPYHYAMLVLSTAQAPSTLAEDAQRGKSGKFKLPTAFKRPGSRSAAAGGEAGASSPGGSAHGGASFDPVAALGEFYGGSGPPSPDAWERSGGGGGDVQPQGGAGQPADGGLLSDADLIDYPFLIDGDPTPAAYLLLCCADYLRLYPTGVLCSTL